LALQWHHEVEVILVEARIRTMQLRPPQSHQWPFQPSIAPVAHLGARISPKWLALPQVQAFLLLLLPLLLILLLESFLSSVLLWHSATRFSAYR
jgi:hypothetical protein